VFTVGNYPDGYIHRELRAIKLDRKYAPGLAYSFEKLKTPGTLGPLALSVR
jgi:hypothetical protein